MKTLIASFIIIVIAQISIPAKMIIDKELVLSSGKEYKFKTAPVDPYDPFRGKYITLNYRQNSIDVSREEKWKYDETVFVQFKMDNEGYAEIKSISKEKPSNTTDYLKTTVSYADSYYEKDLQTIHIHYPFKRFYMDENKAYNAERAYWSASRDESSIAYAIVCIKDGDAVLKNVFIDKKEIKDVAEEYHDSH